MSFIDYNFFPILFFLGWNILTTKQFRPNISNTSNFKTLPGLSVFSLEGPLSQSSSFLNGKKQGHSRIFDESKMRMLQEGPIINSINQKALQSYVKHSKTNHTLEFIPEFRFLSENQKLITTPQTNTICSENQTQDGSIFPPGTDKFFYNRPEGGDQSLKKFSGGAFYNYSQALPGVKRQAERWGETQQIKAAKNEKFIINRIAKPTKWLINQDKIHYFTNHHLINNHWKKDFKSNVFHFAYRPKRKTFLSFFSYSFPAELSKIKPIFPEIESVMNLASPFYKMETGPYLNPTCETEPFFKGLCFSQSTISFWEKIQKQLGYTWFFNKITGPQANLFFTPSNSLDGEITPFALKNQRKNGSILQKRDLKHQTFSTKKTIKNNHYDHDSTMFKTGFLCIKENTNELNRINLIQKRRAKIRLLLRVSDQNIYSLNQFQIPLCFSKIFKPAIFFTHSSRFNLASSFSKSVENNDPSIFKTFVFNHFFNPIHQVKWGDNRSFFKTNFETRTNNQLKKPPINTELLNIDNSTLNRAKNELESQNSRSRTPFLQNLESADHSFVNVDQEIDFVDNYKKRKKNWYMKTQFFQHIAWNMKHSILDQFSSKADPEGDFELLLHTNDLSVKNNDFATKSSHQNKKSGLNKHYFSEKPKKTLQGYTICQNYFLTIYAGSWYYENLAFPYSIFNTTSKIPLLRGHSEAFFNWWQKVFFKQKHVTGKEKLLESKRVAIMSLYARQLEGENRYNSLKKPYYWPYQNYDQAILGGSRHLDPTERTSRMEENQTQLFTFPRVEEKWKGHFNNSKALNVSPQGELWGENQMYKKDPFFEKSQTRLESDIGIYSLAHKLSSVGFGNGNNSSHIYPWRYNDSYRYNFQNMNLLNQGVLWPSHEWDGLKNVLGFSDFKNQNTDPSIFSRKNTNSEQSFTRDKTTHFSRGAFLNFRKFLDFQNPIFSKIYAPVFQPQGLNLLSFLTNSFLNVMPPSFLETPSRESFFLPDQIESIIRDHPHYLKNRIGFQNTPKKKMLHSLYHKLPVNGIHTNPYPWITQNAFDRWSSSNSLSDSSFFSPTRDKKRANYARVKNHTPTSELTTRVNIGFPTLSQKPSLKNHRVADSQLHFTEKASCIKKPSVFFSSFRYLPYFFISETVLVPSRWSARGEPLEKKLFFPQANLSLFSPVISPSNQLNGGKNIYRDLSIPKYDLFNNNILKENQKKQVLQTRKGCLQHKYFSLKPLSTFVKKEFGYETSLFSWAPKTCSKNNKKIFRPTERGEPASAREQLIQLVKSWTKNYWPNHNSIQKTNLVPVQKNTWKVFPPLFQPLTVRFMDLNLPRTWSSELLTLRFNTSFFKMSQKDQKRMPLNTNWSNGFQNTKLIHSPLKKESFGSNPVASHILSPLEQKGPRVKQQTLSNILAKNLKWNVTEKNFFRFSLPFYFSDFFRFPRTENNPFNTKYGFNTESYESAFPLTSIGEVNDSLQLWNNNQKFEKKKRSPFNQTKSPAGANSKIVVYGEKPLLKNRTPHGPPLKNQKESISLPNYLKNITNQNYQNLCPNNLNELYSVFWILFNKTLFIYLSLHYLRKFISFLGTEYIRNLFKIFVTMKFIDGNILSIIKTFQDFNFQLNQQNVIDIKVNKQLKQIKPN